MSTLALTAKRFVDELTAELLVAERWKRLGLDRKEFPLTFARDVQNAIEDPSLVLPTKGNAPIPRVSVGKSGEVAEASPLKKFAGERADQSLPSEIRTAMTFPAIQDSCGHGVQGEPATGLPTCGLPYETPTGGGSDTPSAPLPPSTSGLSTTTLPSAQCENGATKKPLQYSETSVAPSIITQQEQLVDRVLSATYKQREGKALSFPERVALKKFNQDVDRGREVWDGEGDESA